MTTTTARAQGVEYLGADHGWTVYTDDGHVLDAAGTPVTFADEDAAWAFVDEMNAPA